MRAVELAAVGAYLGLLVPALQRLCVEIPALALALLCGWLLADLFSGLVHWALDSFGSVRTPLFGPAFIRPFREHHADPQGMTRHDFIEVNGASCLGCLPVLAAAAFMPMEDFPQAVLTCFSLGILLTNQCHKWAHETPEKLNRVVRFLQARGIILKAEEHRFHHTPPFDSHFCTASGWLNRPLDLLLRALR